MEGLAMIKVPEESICDKLNKQSQEKLVEMVLKHTKRGTRD